MGVDEAGRGPLAGPVVVAAVRLRPDQGTALVGARDSKTLSPRSRESLFALIRGHAEAVSVAWAHPSRIDSSDILKETLEAMSRAARRAWTGGSLILVDGNREIPALAAPQEALVRGDGRSLAVACASIVAKVVRDRWMRRLAGRYPGYLFEVHKGYPTKLHREALSRLGPSPVHRRSFRLHAGAA